MRTITVWRALMVAAARSMMASLPRTGKNLKRISVSSNFVEDGYRRLLDAIEAEVRPEVERKYAAEWNAAGLVRRWFLLRRIEREIVDSVAERSADISPESLF